MHAAAVPEAGPQRSFAHPQCALCAGAATSLVAGTDSARAVDRFDLEEARPDGSHLIFLLHGRHETTSLVRAHIQLCGRESGSAQASGIHGIYEPRDLQDRGFRTLLGVTRERAVPSSPEQQSPVIVPGTFLIFGDERGASRGLSTLPIAHILTYRVAQRVG